MPRRSALTVSRFASGGAGGGADAGVGRVNGEVHPAAAAVLRPMAAAGTAAAGTAGAGTAGAGMAVG